MNASNATKNYADRISYTVPVQIGDVWGLSVILLGMMMSSAPEPRSMWRIVVGVLKIYRLVCKIPFCKRNVDAFPTSFYFGHILLFLWLMKMQMIFDKWFLRCIFSHCHTCTTIDKVTRGQSSVNDIILVARSNDR